jgi:adenosine deaminase
MSVLLIGYQTDDVGIFESCLSREFLLLAEHFSLGEPELVKLVEGSIDVAFCSDEEKEQLRERLQGFVDQRRDDGMGRA